MRLLLTAIPLAYLLLCIPYAVRTYVFIGLALRYYRGAGGLPGGRVPAGRRWTVSLIVPCHNEAAIIETTIRAALAQELPAFVSRYEILFVDDASTDGTGRILDAWAAATGRLRVIHRPVARGKPAALNEALRVASGELVVFIDADHALRANAIRRLVTPLAAGTAEAVQGRCVVRNGHMNLLTRLIRLDYTVGYLMDLPARSLVGTCPIAGSTMALTRAVFDRIGAFSETTLTEDTEFSLRLMQAGIRVAYDVNAVSAELAVSTVRGYIRQRRRWANGHNTVMFRWLRDPALWRLPVSRLDVLLYLCVYLVPVFGFFAVLALGLQLVLHVPSAVSIPGLPVLALGLAAAYPAQLIVAALLTHRYTDVLYIPVYVVRGMVEPIIAVLGLMDCLRKRQTWQKTDHAMVRAAG